jgi:hypothetical protein
MLIAFIPQVRQRGDVCSGFLILASSLFTTSSRMIRHC